MSAGERLYRVLAILVVGMITAATAALVAAIALISRKTTGKPPVIDRVAFGIGAAGKRRHTRPTGRDGRIGASGYRRLPHGGLDVAPLAHNRRADDARADVR